MNESEMSPQNRSRLKPGVCIPWEQKRKDLARISGDEELLRDVWEELEGPAYIYIWHCLVSF